jgi:hypothetical protein
MCRYCTKSVHISWIRIRNFFGTDPAHSESLATIFFFRDPVSFLHWIRDGMEISGPPPSAASANTHSLPCSAGGLPGKWLLCCKYLKSGWEGAHLRAAERIFFRHGFRTSFLLCE